MICAFLPQSSNVKIDTFRVSNKYSYTSEYVNMIEKVSEQNQTSKCIMIFTNIYNRAIGIKMYLHAEKR